MTQSRFYLVMTSILCAAIAVQPTQANEKSSLSIATYATITASISALGGSAYYLWGARKRQVEQINQRLKQTNTQVKAECGPGFTEEQTNNDIRVIKLKQEKKEFRPFFSFLVSDFREKFWAGVKTLRSWWAQDKEPIVVQVPQQQENPAAKPDPAEVDLSLDTEETQVVLPRQEAQQQGPYQWIGMSRLAIARPSV